MKTFKCIVKDDWMGSLENAYLSITSPTGKNLTLRKLSYWDNKDQFSQEDFKIVHVIRDKVSRYIKDTGKVMINYKINLTKEEMQQFKNLVEKA